MEFMQTKPGVFIKTEKAGQGTVDGFEAYLEGMWYKYHDLSDSFVNKIYVRNNSNTSIWHQLSQDLKKEDPTFDPDQDYIIIYTNDKNVKKSLKQR